MVHPGRLFGNDFLQHSCQRKDSRIEDTCDVIQKPIFYDLFQYSCESKRIRELKTSSASRRSLVILHDLLRKLGEFEKGRDRSIQKVGGNTSRFRAEDGRSRRSLVHLEGDSLMIPSSVEEFRS